VQLASASVVGRLLRRVRVAVGGVRAVPLVVGVAPAAAAVEKVLTSATKSLSFQKVSRRLLVAGDGFESSSVRLVDSPKADWSCGGFSYYSNGVQVRNAKGR